MVIIGLGIIIIIGLQLFQSYQLKTKIMSTLADLQTALANITASTTQLGTDIQALAAKIATPGGLSQADLDATVASLNTIGANLIALDGTVKTDTPA
jgi:hypothetical protein